jgi:hypothetical protein
MTQSAAIPVPADQVPGITSTEHRVMLAAAARFQHIHAVISPRAAAGITALTAPAPPDAAGTLRSRRAAYIISQLHHDMVQAGTAEHAAVTATGSDLIPGITGTQHAVMLAAATVFQRDHAVFRPRVAEQIAALTAPAPADAAGILRPRRASYLINPYGHHMRQAG